MLLPAPLWGENNAGAYVTLYGNNFGASAGTVTIAGVKATTYKLWGAPWLWYQKIAFQIPANTPQGATAITVTTANGASNTAPFTVRSGNIYCVSTSGNDASSGKFPSSCWATMPKAVHTMSPGDISYVENGVTATAQDPFAPYNAAISITSSGTAADPIALVAYPGATATVNTSQNYAIRTPAVSGPGPYWTIAGTLRDYKRYRARL